MPGTGPRRPLRRLRRISPWAHGRAGAASFSSVSRKDMSNSVRSGPGDREFTRMFSRAWTTASLAGERQYRPLRGCVGDLRRGCTHGGHERSSVDDGAAARAPHGRNSVLASIENTFEIDGEGLVDRLIAGRDGIGVVGEHDAGVVERDVEPPVGLLGGPHSGGQRRHRGTRRPAPRWPHPRCFGWTRQPRGWRPRCRRPRSWRPPPQKEVRWPVRYRRPFP